MKRPAHTKSEVEETTPYQVEGGGDHPMAEGRRVMTRITNRRIGVKCPETHFLGLVKTKTETNG